MNYGSLEPKYNGVYLYGYEHVTSPCSIDDLKVKIDTIPVFKWDDFNIIKKGYDDEIYFEIKQEYSDSLQSMIRNNMGKRLIFACNDSIFASPRILFLIKDNKIKLIMNDESHVDNFLRCIQKD